jgi:hypothetical protein
MKAVITKDLRLLGGQLVKNEEFQRFAAHWDFTARACRPYRAQTKGKVERPIHYVRDNFVYGRAFLGDGDLHEQWALAREGESPDPRHHPGAADPELRAGAPPPEAAGRAALPVAGAAADSRSRFSRSGVPMPVIHGRAAAARRLLRARGRCRMKAAPRRVETVSAPCSPI